MKASRTVVPGVLIVNTCLACPREGLDLVLDGSGSLDEDDIPESEFPLRCAWLS